MHTTSASPNSSTMSSFTLFPDLPAEIRLMIWERVPQPRRIIAQTVCFDCFRTGASLARAAKIRDCITTRHPDWRIRYIVQPRNQAIFPPLHACRESRLVWLGRYFRPPRYLDLRDYGYLPSRHGLRLSSGAQVRFDVPFISYEADVFTVLESWTQADMDIGSLAHLPRSVFLRKFDGYFDPFLGLDRSRIRNVAVREGYERLFPLAARLDVKSLTSLRSLSVLSLGPDPRSDRRDGKFHISSAQVQQLNCDICDLPDRAVTEHRLFNQDRLSNPDTPEAHVPVFHFRQALKGCLWHTERVTGRDMAALIRHEFYYVFLSEFLRGLRTWSDNSGSWTCPLHPLPGCGSSGHTYGDIASWEPPFTVGFMLLYDADWAQAMGDRSPYFELISARES
ncbi:hypothetical protein VTH82DRAFT_1174 [Thermothelomyces myriococcoides]